MAGVLERAHRDLDSHQLWRARRRLEGYIGSQGYDRQVIELLGEVCERMGDIPAAGRFWFFCDTSVGNRQSAVETFVRDCGGEPLVIFSQLPRKLRATRLERFPIDVQKRLRLLLAAQPERIAQAGRGRQRLTSVDLFVFSALILIGLFCLYCFSVGIAHVFAIR